MKVMVTGSNGFIGREFVSRLARSGHETIRVVRTPLNNRDSSLLENDDDILEALGGCDCIVHLAGRAHVINEQEVDPLIKYREVNVALTLRLAELAARMGVRRMVFISSIKVNGESTKTGSPFTSEDKVSPLDPYAISKWEAEQGLLDIAQKSDLEIVIIRPPLVYGPGVKGNFSAMLRWLRGGIPLPLLGVSDNRRSLVALDNLVDLIMTCLTHPAAKNQTFLVSDGEDLSTVDLLRRMAIALGCKARLFYIPLPILKIGAVIVNKLTSYQRLSDSLHLDMSKTQNLLGWKPLVSVDEGLRKTAIDYKIYNP
jgi:nucleoside-diphosphate-sugar epimerase